MERKIKVRKNKPIDKDGYPIKRWEVCFKCGKKFCLAFAFSQQDYARKNFWFYWTERKEDQEKFICSPCLRNFYLSERKTFLATIKSLKKKNHLRTYVVRNIV